MQHYIGDAGYYALLVGGLGTFFWLKHRFERALAARVRERALGARPLDRLRAGAEPAALLMPAGAAGFSKFGGRPDLPAGLGWPTGVDGAMRFLAQIDLAAGRSAKVDWLPTTGVLYFFCDAALHDGPEFARVLWGDEGPSSGADRIGEHRISLLPVRSLPSSFWLGVQHDFGASVEGADGSPLQLRGPHHQLGGYPDEIQSEQMARSCARLAAGYWSLPDEPESWRLLLQIDSDPDLELEFGDGGRLFVFVREKDARAGDFSRTVSIWQSY
jgi:uncharacterized protein DUF1963